MDWKDVALGDVWSRNDLRGCFQAIYGGVAWPSREPGFAIVVGVTREKHFNNYNARVLDEFESEDTRELVRQAGVLDFKYEPAQWMGDPCNDAADQFLRELNEEREAQTRALLSQGCWLISGPPVTRSLWPARTDLLDMKRPYAYIVPEIRRLLDPRQLWLKTSRAGEYLHAIESRKLIEYEFGDFPALEALAFAVLELRRYAESLNRPPDDSDDDTLARSYVTPSAM